MLVSKKFVLILSLILPVLTHHSTNSVWSIRPGQFCSIRCICHNFHTVEKDFLSELFESPLHLIEILNSSYAASHHQLSEGYNLKNIRFANRFNSNCYFHTLINLQWNELISVVKKSGFNFAAQSWFIWIVGESTNIPRPQNVPDEIEILVSIPLLIIKKTINIEELFWSIYYFDNSQNKIRWNSEPLTYKSVNAEYLRHANQIRSYQRIIVVHTMGTVFTQEFCFLDKFSARNLFRCTPLEPLVGIVISRANLTIKIVQNQLSSKYSATRHLQFKMMSLQNGLLSDVDISHIILTNSVIRSLGTDELRIIYCKYSGPALRVEWGVFLAPFHTSVWTFTLLTIQTIAILGLVLQKISIRASYELCREYIKLFVAVTVFFLNGMPNRSLTSVPIVILAFAAIMNIFMVNEYLSVMTTDFIAYPLEEGIKTISTLFQKQGYRYGRLKNQIELLNTFMITFRLLFGHGGTEIEIFHLVKDDIESKLENGHKLTFGVDTVERNFTHFTREMFRSMVETRGCMLGASKTFQDRKISNDQFSIWGMRCFFLPKNESIEINTSVGFKYSYAGRAGSIMQSIGEAGLVARWSYLDGFAKTLMLSRTLQAEFEESDGFHKLDLASHLQILFHLWMIVLLLSIFCCICGFTSDIRVWMKCIYRNCMQFMHLKWCQLLYYIRYITPQNKALNDSFVKQ